jgi:hypothetical protein
MSGCGTKRTNWTSVATSASDPKRSVLANMGSRSRASGQQALCVYAGCEPGKTIAVIAEWWAASLPMYPYC